MTAYAIVMLSLLILAYGSPSITDNTGINGGVLRFTISNDRVVFNANILGGRSNSSFLVSGSISDSKFLSVNLQFHIVSSILQFLLRVDKVKFKYIDISIRRYSESNMYKLNGSLETLVNKHLLKLLTSFDILVSGNKSFEKIRIKGAIIPVSSDQKLNILALSLLDDVLESLFYRVENMSSKLVKVGEINVERIPTTKGVGARVEVLLNVNNPRIAWKNIIGRVFGQDYLDYIELVFDDRVKDYILDLKLTANDNENIHGRVFIVFNESFSRLLGLNHTRLSSKAMLTYYGAPDKTILNISNMVLEPRNSLKKSLHEIGLFFYRLIGEHNIIVVVESRDASLNAEDIPVKPISVNETTIIWNKSTVLLYLDRIIVSGSSRNINYLMVLVLAASAALGLFYIVRRVSWK